jgi:hypothetical protein
MFITTDFSKPISVAGPSKMVPFVSSTVNILLLICIICCLCSGSAVGYGVKNCEV